LQAHGGLSFLVVRGPPGRGRGEDPQEGASPLGRQKGGRVAVPRRGPAVRRSIQPDPAYQTPLVTQLINRVLLNGKKTLAEHIVYDALEQISQKTANDPVITLKRAVENVRPLLEVKSRRVGGASYQVPIEVKPQRG